MHGLSGNYNIGDNIVTLSNEFLNKKYSKYTFTAQQINMLDSEEVSESITFKEIRNKLLDDLNKLIRALEIYLCEFVETKEIKKKSPDINGLEIDFILSFNCTHIFSKLYEVSIISEQEESNLVDYIHGEANINNTIETNNMVLGIDEYLSDDRKNFDVEFIAFKKFYQRIYKQTGSKYKEWADDIRNEYEEFPQIKTARAKRNIATVCLQHNLYIFGHSLDVTDKDILCDLILNDNVYTTIFYHDKDTMGQKSCKGYRSG